MSIKNRITTDEYGKKVYALSAQDKGLVGNLVIYRIGEHQAPRLGRLSHRNPHPEWETGCWIVRADHDNRLYTLQSHKGAGFRLADRADLKRYAKRREGSIDRQIEQVASQEYQAPPVTQPIPAIPEPKRSPAGIGEQIAAQVEKEMAQ